MGRALALITLGASCVVVGAQPASTWAIVDGTSQTVHFDLCGGPRASELTARRAAREWGLEHDVGVVGQLAAQLDAAGVEAKECQPRQGDAYLSLLLRSITGELNTERLTEVANRAMGYESQTWPALALTMVDAEALKSLRWMVETVTRERIEGNIVETGVWRGGASVWAAAVLQHEIGISLGPRPAWGPAPSKDWRQLGLRRTVFVCDSFAGLPMNSTARDHGWWQHQRHLRVGKEEVMESFERHLPDVSLAADLDDVGGEGQHAPDAAVAVTFVKGFVRETAPRLKAQLARDGDKGTSSPLISILRIDVDMYEGYMDVLFNLATHVPKGSLTRQCIHRHRSTTGTTFVTQRSCSHALVPSDSGTPVRYADTLIPS